MARWRIDSEPPDGGSVAPRTPPADLNDGSRLRRRDDLLRTERTMFGVRWAATAIGVVLVLTYDALPFPPGYRLAAFGVIGVLPVISAAAWVWLRRLARSADLTPARGLRRARTLAVTTVSLDLLVASAVVWVFAFDPASAHWAVLFVVPLLGAARFHLPGAILAWAAVTGLYVARQAWAAVRFDDVGFSASSIAFRMGLAFLVALVAGLLARDLARERERTAAALAEVERVDRLRANLVDALAHDIRSPLTVIQGALTALARTGSLTPEQESFHRMARAQTWRLYRLATGMLDLARLEQGLMVLQPEPVDVAEVARRAVESVGKPDVSVRVDGEPVAMADADRTEQILFNLVSNALVHGEPPVEVVVRAGADGDVVVQVCDRGGGVGEADRDRLFLPYAAGQRADSVGLGLWLVRALAEAQGGTADYHEGDGGGAVFEVHLPGAEPAAGAGPEAPAAGLHRQSERLA